MRICKLLFCLFLTNYLFAQEYATFSTDTTRFQSWRNKDGKISEYLSKQAWLINGQEMR